MNHSKKAIHMKMTAMRLVQCKDRHIVIAETQSLKSRQCVIVIEISSFRNMNVCNLLVVLGNNHVRRWGEIFRIVIN